MPELTRKLILGLGVWWSLFGSVQPSAAELPGSPATPPATPQAAPPGERDLLVQAKQLIVKERYDDALPLLLQAEMQDPNRPEVVYLLANVLDLRDEREQAAIRYARYLLLRPGAEVRDAVRERLRELELTLAIGRVRLTVVTKPAPARVSLLLLSPLPQAGGAPAPEPQHLGHTPLVRWTEPGRYRLQVVREGCASVEREVRLQGARARVEVPLTCRPNGRLFVYSTPPEATLLLDGRPVARLPLLEPLTVPDGEHELQVERAGHEPWRSRIKIAARQLHRIEARLRPLPGRLLLKGAPAGAAARLDGAELPRWPWATPVEGEAGDHWLRLELPGHAPWEQRVTLLAGELTTVEVQLTPRPGQLLLTGELPEGQLRVDGQVAGALPLTAPLELAAGPHLLDLRVPGFRTRQLQVEIPPGGPREVAAELEPLPLAYPRWPGWLGLGVAAVGAGVGLWLHLDAALLSREAVDRQDGSWEQNERAHEQYSVAVEQLNSALGWYGGAGVVALASGVYLWLAYTTFEAEEGQDGSDRSAVTWLPAVRPGGLTWRF